jgi:Rha family phage regulatory protein
MTATKPVGTIMKLAYAQFITPVGDQLTTDSRKVAEVHGKRHTNVLRLISQRIQEAGEFGRLNFEPSSYVNEQGKVQPMYVMTKDGYQFLVGRMTGKKAVEHQIAFIEAFNAMAAHIKAQTEGLQFQFLRKELAYNTRKSKVSGAAREMRTWQDAKPILLGDMASLLSRLQPSLFAGGKH